MRRQGDFLISFVLTHSMREDSAYHTIQNFRLLPDNLTYSRCLVVSQRDDEQITNFPFLSFLHYFSYLDNLVSGPQ